jgi:hypothetical protein
MHGGMCTIFRIVGKNLDGRTLVNNDLDLVRWASRKPFCFAGWVTPRLQTCAIVDTLTSAA